MADTKTAAEWQTVLSNAQAEQAAAKQKATDAFNAAFQANANVESARNAVDNEVAANGGKLPLFSSAYSNYKAALADQATKATANENAQAQLSNINATVNQASQSLTTAQNAPAGVTASTPDPASPNPGDPTVVVGDPIPTSTIIEQVPVETPQTPQTTQEEAYTPLQEPPGTQDEFSGIDAQVENNENALQEPPNVDPEEDPMQAALDANRTEDTPGPTEQAVIDATDEPQLAKEDRAKLEEEQAANRAALAQEESAAGFEVKSVNAVRAKAVQAVQRNARQQEDWRVRLQLAQGATYLYNDPNCKQGDLLYPLKATGGVIFPYTPAISSSYRANYDPSDIVHTNYKQYFYKNSSVDELSIQADFTAQDTTEALYMLAMIHFFRTVTKMFYGKDANPRAGTPPPLCYLSGYGQYQYSDHPLLVTSFAYNLPNDVDYIRAGSTTQWAGQNVGAYGSAPAATSKGFSLASLFRLGSSKLNKGGVSKEPEFSQLSNSQATYVPTKLSIQLGLVPVVTRYDIANNFSVSEYAKGKLLKGGIW